MDISKPAILASIAYLILAFMILLPLNEDSAQTYSLTRRLFLVIIMLIPIALSIYSINCMVVGNCQVWAWVQGIAIAFWVLLFIVANMISAQRADELDCLDGGCVLTM